MHAMAPTPSIDNFTGNLDIIKEISTLQLTQQNPKIGENSTNYPNNNAYAYRYIIMCL